MKIEIPLLVSEEVHANNSLWTQLNKQDQLHFVSFSELRDFIAHCIEESPSFVGISLDHEYKNIRRLPQAIRSILKCKAFVFAEKEKTKVEDEEGKHPKGQVGIIPLMEEEFISQVIKIQGIENNFLNKRVRTEDEKLEILDSLYTMLGEKNQFGEIKISDQEQLLSDHKKKKKHEIRQVQKNNESALFASCENSLGEVLKLTKMTHSNDFSITMFNAFIVELPYYQGIVCVGVENEGLLDNSTLKVLGSSLFDSLKESGIEVSLSGPFQVHACVEKFVGKFSSFSEFTLHYENSNQKQYAVSFIKRESVLPQMNITDNGNMIAIDVNLIPPQTTVNFDGYILLKKKGKYIKYFKKNSQLTLEQNKKFSNTSSQIIYVPINNKKELITFFIQNTINWELALEMEHLPA
jgi:hypothetical protein